MNMEFNIWLERELEQRNWNHSDLAREAHRSHGAISQLFNGLSKPTIGICTAIADAFQMPRKIVYEKAGLTQPEPESDTITEELLFTQRLLPEAERLILLDLARTMMKRHNAKNNKRAENDYGGVDLV